MARASVEFNHAKRRIQSHAVQTQAVLAVTRVRAGNVFLPIAGAVAVGVAERAVDTGRIFRIEAIAQLPFIGQTIVIGVRSVGGLIQPTGGRRAGLPVGGIVGEGNAGDALQ